MPRRAAAFAALFLLAAGCVAHAARGPAPLAASAGERGASAMTWAPGNWWAYHALVGNQTIDITLVVDHADASSYHLGSNSTAGFFGLPFTGNVTRATLGPVLGASDEWPLYRLPLADGASWTFTLYGHDARTTARAAIVDAPGDAPEPGYALESTAYGATFARYDYSPAAGWFTRLTVWDPATHEQLLDAKLTGFGVAYGREYYVQTLVREWTVQSPLLPGSDAIELPTGYDRLELQLTAHADAGLVDAAIRDARGHDLAHARALAGTSDSARTSAEGAPAGWRLAYAGAGAGTITLRAFGVTAVSR